MDDERERREPMTRFALHARRHERDKEMTNFPVSEYESTLKDLKDMNVVTTNEEFVELLVESSVKVERRQSRHRGVVKSKEHTNKYEARIFLDET